MANQRPNQRVMVEIAVEVEPESNIKKGGEEKMATLVDQGRILADEAKATVKTNIKEAKKTVKRTVKEGKRTIRKTVKSL